MTTNIYNKLEEHGAEWDVEKFPAYYLNEKGEFIQVPNRNFTVRMDIRMPFEAVSDDYTVITNQDGFQFLTDLVEDDGLRIKRVLQFGMGREIAIVTEVPEHVNIGEEEYFTNMVWTARHDGRGAGQGFGTNVCIVCKNTLEHAKGSAKFKYTIRHTKDASLRLEDAREAIKLNFKKVERYQTIAEELLGRALTKESYNEYLKAVVKLDEQKTEADKKKANKVRHQLHDIMVNREYLENYRNKEWALVQAVTDYESNVRPYRKETRKFQALTSGAPLTNRVFEVLDV